MPADWPVMSLAECAAREPYSTQIGPFGSALKADAYRPTGVPLLRGVNVNQGRFHDDDFVFIEDATAGRLAKYQCRSGDVLLVHRGTLGKIGLIPATARFPKYIMGNSMLRVRTDPTKILPEYLYYWLTSADGQQYIFSRMSQVGVPAIPRPLATLRQVRLPVPPLSEQRAIAAVLGALDDKIELNLRMCATLEAMVRALYRAWFVDFDPVRAKAEGRDSGLADVLDDLFPAALYESEVGEVPEGWRVVPVGELASVVGGSTPRTDVPEYWSEGQHHWVTPKDLAGLRTPVLLDTSRRVTDAGLAQIGSGLLPPGTVLMSSRAPIGYLAITEVPTAINQGFIAMVASGGVSNVFLLNWAREAQKTIISRANGSTFLEISKGNFRPIPVVTPTQPVMRAFDALAQPLHSRIVACERESLTLTALRDALLPRLISGELRIPDAERIAVEAWA